MAQKLTLFDLFGASDVAEALTRWPQLVRPRTGVSVNWPPAGITQWLEALNLGTSLSEVRTGSHAERVAIEAKVRFDAAAAGYPQGFPFVLASMPDVRFLIQHMSASTHARLYASLSDLGAEVLIEGLPVEIELPSGLFTPHPEVPEPLSEDPAGNFSAGGLDGLRIVLRRDHASSIFVHVRLHIDAEGEVTLRTAVPVSFGKCTFTGLPCLGVHGFELIASPKRALTEMAWLRHEVTPWAPSLVGPHDGCFSVRTIDLDTTHEPFKGPLDWLRRQGGEDNPHLASDSTVTVVGPDRALTPEDRAAEPTAEFVLDDLVLPFWSPWVVPIPRHVTVGVRRRIIDPNSPAAIFAFEKAPVRFYPSFGPLTGVIVESFFYRSRPAALADEDIGLTFDAAFVFGGDDRDHERSSGQALRLALGEHWTLAVGYKRDFDTVAGKPADAGVFQKVLHFEITSKLLVDIMGIRLGYSLGRGIVENASFGDSVEATLDLWIASEPSDGGAIEIKSLGGQTVGFAVEGIGWRLGAPQFSGLSAPDGVVIVFGGRFGLILQEISLAAEQGASYLTFSGGFLIDIPSGFEGAFTFRRLRFRVAGDETQPKVKLDGFFLYLKTTGFYLEAGGYFKDTTEGNTRIKEFGLTGALEIGIGGVGFKFGLDLIVGNLRSPAEEFDYLLLQMFFRGSIMICLFELRGVRVLFARNMQPKLAPVDREANQLRYYNWYRATNPLTVPGDRRLAAWQPRGDAWALGIGADGSFAKMGSAFAAGVFVLGVSGPDEKGVLIVLEVMLLSSPKPIGYLAVELDFEKGRYSGILGVELTVKNFMRDAPDFIDRIAKLTGTLFIGNDPPTVAIGRLADERTWLQYRIDIDLWVRAFMVLGACLELREGGPNGGGFVFRIEGQIAGGVVAIRYNAGFGFTLTFFSTGSVDYSLVIWIEAGIRAILFAFLRFGLSVRADLRVVGADPTRGELTVTFRFETPWFLPDVSWTLEEDWGEVRVADLATSTMPLLAAGGTEGLTQKRAALHLERARPQAGVDDGGPAPVFTINELRAPGPSESDRLTRFEGNAELRALATDTTVSIAFSVAVNDLVGVSGAAGANLGSQESGDLRLTYELIGIRVRRRSRFGVDRNWYVLEERKEMTADFSDPSGVSLSGAFLPGELFTAWDHEVRIEGQTATKQLLINAKTPFEFATENPETDEEIVADNPSWPCCHRRGKYRQWRFHEVVFTHDAPGLSIAGDRLFSNSVSHLRLLRPFVVRPALASGLASGELIAAMPLASPGVLWRAELAEDAAYCFVRLAVPVAGAFALLAFDLAGGQVASVPVPGNAGGFQDVAVHGSGPIRRLELRARAGGHAARRMHFYTIAATHAAAVLLAPEIETARVAYISLREYLDVLRERAACDDASDKFQDAYSGRGKLFLLPNHDYEISITTRVTGLHPSRPGESVELDEYAYLKTKGFPGLNAVSRVGEELEPYVRSAYAGGRGLLYREEPIALQLSEDYSIALPLTLRPAGSSIERTQLVRMQLLVEPEAAILPNAVFTATDADWIVTNRSILGSLIRYVWLPVLSTGATRTVTMTSIDPFRGRLADLTQRPDAPCALPDPRDVSGTVLIAPPQGEADPQDPSRELWPADAKLAAIVRLERAAFVERVAFESRDDTALTFARDTAAGGANQWSVDAGRLRCTPGNERRFAIFGETSWNHLTIQAEILVTGTAAGVGVSLPAGGVVSRGLFAMIETAGAAHRLRLYRRAAPGDWSQLASAELTVPDPTKPISLIVTTFDDRIRASVGEVFIEAERNADREGRIALVAHGDAQFASLRVRGLAMYAFPVRTSRFRSFADHIGSWSGRLDEIQPNALGPGSTTSSVAARWMADAAAIGAAMAPDQDAQARDHLFRNWVDALGLPLKEDINTLELSRFVEAAGTSALLLESPEPLDFTQEVSVRLERRVKVGGWRPFPFDVVGVELATLSRAATTERRGDADLRESLFASQRIGAASVALEPTAAAPRSLIQDITYTRNELMVQLDRQPLVRSVRTNLLFIERTADTTGSQPSFRVYKAKGSGAAFGRSARVRAALTDQVTTWSKVSSLLPVGAASKIPIGAIVALDPDNGVIIDWWPGTYTWKPIEVRVLQDHSGRRALLAPVAASVLSPLQPGQYRLTLTLDRARWSTTEPPDAENRYHDEQTLSLRW